MFRNIKPHHPPSDKSSKYYSNLVTFSQEVEFILQTTSTNFLAAATYMKPPPFDSYKKSVTFPSVGNIVGMFAGHKAALVVTDIGDYTTPYLEQAMKNFPNAKFIVGIGTGYSMYPTEHKLGDVLVAKHIYDMSHIKIKLDGTLMNIGKVTKVKPELFHLFCADTTCNFKVNKPDPITKKSRNAKVFAGRLISFTMFRDNQQLLDKIRDAFPEVIGGEAEGAAMLSFHNKLYDGVIMIKAVAGYGDGNKENSSWQITAAMAAFSYAEEKLSNWQGKG